MAMTSLSEFRRPETMNNAADGQTGCAQSRKGYKARKEKRRPSPPRFFSP